MPDDLTKRRPQDASKINIHETYEVNWWCSEFNCTKAQLEAAVKAVGVSAAAVKKYLGKKFKKMKAFNGREVSSVCFYTCSLS